MAVTSSTIERPLRRASATAPGEPAAPERRLTRRDAAWIVAACALAFGPGLGSSGRLTYHEAIAAQSAREMVASTDALVPRLGGVPWVEKPPLATWAIAALGWLVGGIDETVARAPSVLAAIGLSLAVAAFAARAYGPRIGRLAGLLQATTVWTLMRGRLAEPDIVLAALVAGALGAFARVRERPPGRGADLAFFALLGASGLVKGVGFGPALISMTVAAVLAWDRDVATLRRLLWAPGLALALLLALGWPLAVLTRHPEALGVWVLHVAERLGGPSRTFATEPWGEYLLAPLWQTLPWSPLALAGAAASLRRARSERGGPDRVLAAWAVVPALAVSLASVRNAHYLVPALAPWSVWAAIRLDRRCAGRSVERVVLVLALAIGLGIALVGPRYDRRGAEWGWYTAARHLGPTEPLVLLADDWDKAPYPTPFGPVPADLAVRLYYLDRPPGSVSWHRGPETLQPPRREPAPFAVIARERDRPALERLGRVKLLSRGPTTRWDRAFTMYRVTPGGTIPLKDSDRNEATP